MNNHFLVDLVKKRKSYLGVELPEDKRILEVMEKVDRKDFIPSERVMVRTVDSDLLEKIRQSYGRFMYLDDALNKGGKVNDGDYDIILKDLLDPIEDLIGSCQQYFMDLRDLAYTDTPLPIAHNQTNPQPSMVRFISSQLDLEKGMKLLEIGTGSGYQAAVVSHLIGDAEYLVTVERIRRLKKFAEENLKKHFGNEFERRFKFVHGDGSIGLEKEAPFDRIYLTAGVELDSFDPAKLAEQLKDFGILLFPEKDGYLIKQTYIKNKLEDEKKFKGVTFVSLKGKNS